MIMSNPLQAKFIQSISKKLATANIDRVAKWKSTSRKRHILFDVLRHRQKNQQT